MISTTIIFHRHNHQNNNSRFGVRAMAFRRHAVAGILSASSMVGVVHAQSSVTLYGIADTAVQYISNVRGHALVQEGNTHSPDIYGLRGVEDLGTGLRTIFDLQGEYLLNNGQSLVPGTLFNRKAYIGLQSDAYGTLTLGRQPSFMYDVLSNYQTPFLLGNILSLHQGNLDEIANFYQFANAAKYVSPTFGGLSAGAEFGFGNVPGNFSAGRNYAFFVQYKSGPLGVAAVYANENNRYLELSSFIGLPSLFGTSLNQPEGVVANRLVNWGVGATYQISHVQLHATFTQTRITLATGQGSANTVDAGANWTVRPDDIVALGGWVENLDGGDWKTISISNTYLFSKRTSIYQQVTYQRASGAHSVASLAAAGLASGRSTSAVSIGIQHFF
ncbi:porin [Paraburkholderia bannensis]|uniref:porin n=1 Tax=Paraburkholderia bannensis TaxID=765414 RepID=UPI002ABD921F|nr:porin [Paraburkholderia bannensis]